jgi:hypothetical protein
MLIGGPTGLARCSTCPMLHNDGSPEGARLRQERFDAAAELPQIGACHVEQPLHRANQVERTCLVSVYVCASVPPHWPLDMP